MAKFFNRFCDGCSELIICIFVRIFNRYMIKNIILCFLVIFSVGCGSHSSSSHQHPEAKGGRIYGGTLRVNENDRYVSLYPYLISDAISHSISNQIYEGLVRFNSKNSTQLLPAIAESWEIDSSGTIYTFKLKKGVRFHDDACFPEGIGREVTASDFKYCFTLLCTASEDNGMFESSFKGKIKGADDYYERSKNGKPSGDVEGIKVPDNYSLQITLTSPSNTFLFFLADPAGYVFPHEAVEKYGSKTTVGTGPFVLVNSDNNDFLTLVRNQNYYRTDSIGNVLPFLDTVIISFIPDKTKELEMFKKGETHIIFGLPASSISEMVESQIADFSSKHPKFLLQRNPELSVQFYQFNILKKPFDNILVRKAFSYAIDREKIISDVLNTEAFGPGICGLTPPGISGYDITSIRGYHFNPDSAKLLLAKAGYPNGKDFPHITIELNSGGGKHVDVVEEVKKQLKNVLNVDVDFVVVPFSQKLEDAKYAKVEMFRSGWMADYPSPENFLFPLYGATVPDSIDKPSYPNTIHYKNPAFDSLMRLGFATRKQEESYEYFMKAEQLMMKDAPLIVLWYDESLKMIHSFVKGFYFDPMNHKDFSEVYILKNPPSEKP